MPVEPMNGRTPDSFAGVSILGIDDTLAPSLSSFPRTFAAFKAWQAVIESEEFKRRKEQNVTNSTLWYDVIQWYLRECERQGAFPFQHSTQQTRNDMVIAFLRRARFHLVRYIEECGFFDKVSMLRVKRRYSIEGDHFRIHCTGLLFPLEDPTFRQWLTTMPWPRMRQRVGTPRTYEYELRSTPGVTVWVDVHRRHAMEIGYTIMCPTIPIYPDYSDLPTNVEMAQFSEQVLWLPIVRARRIAATGSRLF